VIIGKDFELPSIHTLRTEVNRIVTGLRDLVGEQGLAKTAGRVAAVARGQLTYPIIRARRQNERFGFRGKTLPYAFARYNNSFLNERTVEIAIADHFLAGVKGRLLEIGNVLAHYGHTGHTVVDKYENIPGVLNVDIVDYQPEIRFDTVVAISTLEHVGWDETPREPDKVLRAVEAIRGLVADGGRLLITLPIGYNPRLDEALKQGEVKFPQESWLVRTNQRNDWVETDRDECLARRYNDPFTGANGLYVGMISD
jgi:SAM-dependent methyltransferase